MVTTLTSTRTFDFENANNFQDIHFVNIILPLNSEETNKRSPAYASTGRIFTFF